MNDSSYVTPAIGVLGILGTITLEHINTFVAILVGMMTLVWLGIKIYKEIKNES